MARNLRALLEFLHSTGDSWIVKSLRDGMVRSLPIVVLGSMSLLLNQVIVLSGLGQKLSLLNSLAGLTLSLYLLTLKVLSIYIAISVSSAVAQYQDVPKETSAILSLATLLMLTGKLTKTPEGWSLNLSQLSSEGIFVAIASGFLVPLIIKRFGVNLKVKDLPEAVSASIASLLPGLIVLSLALVIRASGIDLVKLTSGMLFFLRLVGDSLIAVILVNLIIHLLWFFGLHGVSIVDSVMLSLWLTFLQSNAEAIASGTAPQYITAHPFWQWFIWIGGSGGGLSLWIATLLAKSKAVKEVSKASALTVIFNINEPLVYGLPVILNPYLLVPFLLVPIVNGTIAYLAISSGLVNKVFSEPPWILPSPIGALIATGGDWRSLVLIVLNVTLGTLIYLPFIRAYDKALLEKEKRSRGE